MSEISGLWKYQNNPACTEGARAFSVGHYKEEEDVKEYLKVPKSEGLSIIRVPGEIKRREVELGCESWTSFASGCSSTAVQRTLSLWLLSTAVETAIAQCTSRCAKARGHRLNTSIVLAAVHGLSGLFRAVSAVEPSLFRPPPPPPPKQPRFCGRKATWSVEGLSVFSLVLCVMACCWVTCTVYLQVSK